MSRISPSEFETFFERWLVRQEHYLDELISAQECAHEAKPTDLNDLVARVLRHYQEYFDEKSRVLQNDVFALFSPSWETRLELAVSWVTGFKPALAFGIAKVAVENLTEEQRLRMRQLREETRVAEKAVEERLARVQESVAAPPVMEVARRRGREVDGETVEEDAVVARLRVAMEEVVAEADGLRRMTVVKVVEILNPVQNVRFFAATMLLQKRVKIWGLQRGRCQKKG